MTATVCRDPKCDICEVECRGGWCEWGGILYCGKDECKRYVARLLYEIQMDERPFDMKLFRMKPDDIIQEWMWTPEDV